MYLIALRIISRFAFSVGRSRSEYQIYMIRYFTARFLAKRKFCMIHALTHVAMNNFSLRYSL